MTSTSTQFPSTAKLLWRTHTFNPVAEVLSGLVWVIFHSWPLLPGLLAKAFFDLLQGNLTAPLSLQSIVLLLVGLSAVAVPVGEEGGTRFTFKIKPGIYFAPDPVFKGKKRELTARDMEYAMKRFRDPTERSPYSWLFENNIVGFDEFFKGVCRCREQLRLLR